MAMPWTKNVYGVFAKKRGTDKKPKFVGWLQAPTAEEALSRARAFAAKKVKNMTVTDVKPYSKLGRLRRLKVGFYRYLEEVAKGAV